LARPGTANEGSMQSADGSGGGADESIDPSAHKGRGPQDDSVEGNGVWGCRLLVGFEVPTFRKVR
jgi:hypothetical protein